MPVEPYDINKKSSQSSKMNEDQSEEDHVSLGKAGFHKDLKREDQKFNDDVNK